MANKGENSYINLRVWKDSIKLAKDIYFVTKMFPKEEVYTLTSQLRRASVSVSSNIAEGCARNNNREFFQFLGIASGSLAELRTQLMISSEVGILSEVEFKKLDVAAGEISKMLTGLKKSLLRKTEDKGRKTNYA